MTKRTLAQLTEQFKMKPQGEASSGTPSWKKFFQFWKAEQDTTSTVRFLPDADETNQMGFLVENLTHTLVINGKKETVACGKMYGDDCPICALSQSYYDEKSPEHSEALGKKYYRKRSYIGQVLVIDTPIEHDQAQLVKLIEFGPAVFKQIQSAFQSGDMEEAPFELKGGYNFRIKKTKSGEYASYTTSSFAPKQTDVADDTIEALELFNLADHRAPKVDKTVLETMLMADRTGVAVKPAEATEPVEAQEAAPVVAAKAVVPGKISVVDQLRARAAAAKAAQSE